MALSNYEKQKRWREKNRALYNFQQRERRKKNFPVSSGDAVIAERSGAIAGVAPKSGISTIETLRGLVKVEQDRVVEAPVASPTKFGMYRDDSGRPITERAWRALQKLKEKAEKGGYVYDEFSQA